MTKILPLPVTKNKFGRRVADISVEKYYRQIFEEVLEAHRACIENFQQFSDDEAEELVDIITCCVTRLHFMHWYSASDDFAEYLQRIVDETSNDYRVDDDFYIDLTQWVSYAYNAAQISQIVQLMLTEGCGQCAADVEVSEYDEENALAYIIFLCIKRLEYLGYDESARQKIYAKVNDKNRKRGYFED